MTSVSLTVLLSADEENGCLGISQKCRIDLLVSIHFIYSFIQHTFIEHPLCARQCARSRKTEMMMMHCLVLSSLSWDIWTQNQKKKSQ